MIIAMLLFLSVI